MDQLKEPGRSPFPILNLASAAKDQEEMDVKKRRFFSSRIAGRILSPHLPSSELTLFTRVREKPMMTAS
jgi:hypothetical protein